jgi:hypothetical protein
MQRACSRRPSKASRSMSKPESALTWQVLAWVGSRPRSYGEAMEAWRTSCPRLSIWEDAIGDGLVRIEGGGTQPMRQAKVVLTERGQALLDSSPE